MLISPSNKDYGGEKMSIGTMLACETLFADQSVASLDYGTMSQQE